MTKYMSLTLLAVALLCPACGGDHMLAQAADDALGVVADESQMLEDAPEDMDDESDIAFGEDND